MSSIIEVIKINSNNESTRLRLLDMTVNPIEKMAYIARVSHRSHVTSNKTDEELLKDIIRWGHLFVLEHAYATIEISGVSRACSHQLARHRNFSFMQESQKYVDMSDSRFCIPSRMLEDPVAYNMYLKSIEQSFKAYKQLIEAGTSKEDARMVLANGVSTRIIVTGNFKTWREFIHKREIKAAQEEIRTVAREIRGILSEATHSFLWKYEV